MSEKAIIENITGNDISLWSLFWDYLKIGSTAFGGFMALISVVQNYLVEKKKILSHEDMLDGITLASVLPGPVAVNVVTYTGYKIRGLPGAIISFIAIILPSFFLILGLSYAYFTFGNIPAVNSIFMGFIPAVAAIIIGATINLGKKSLTDYKQYLIAFTSMALLITAGSFYTTIAIISASGLIGFLLYGKQETQISDQSPANAATDKAVKPGVLKTVLLLSVPTLLALAFKFQSIISIKLLTVFSSLSLLLFGGGFVFIPMIQEVVVDSHGWLSHKEFIDGIALGQVTPGPIILSATFIGYKVAGVVGAISATIGIFVPPAIVMLICTAYLQKIKNSQTIQAVLKGIRSGVIGMIAAASYVVFITAEQNIMSLIIFVLSLVLLLKFKLEVALLIPLAGLTGYLYY